jgi:2',5'-phosphodiesterase
MSINIISYNILAPELCNPKTFKKCPDEYLDESNRFDKVYKRIEQNLVKYDVIHMQEVSEIWSSQLHMLFFKNNWTYISSKGGASHNGFMSVATAINNTTCFINDISEVRVADELYRYPVDDIPTFFDNINYYYNIVKNKILNLSPPRVHPPMWESMKRKNNKMLIVDIRHNTLDEIISVCNYHMPCHFGSLEAERQMCGFAQLASDCAYLNSRNKYVLAGDFNIKPYDSSYELMTTGKISDVTRDMEQCFDGLWKTNIRQCLKSAYVEVNGEEPKFTNSSHTIFGGVFKETLDYIFMSPGLKANSVLELKCKDKDIYPSHLEGSDHLMIGANISII